MKDIRDSNLADLKKLYFEDRVPAKVTRLLKFSFSDFSFLSRSTQGLDEKSPKELYLLNGLNNLLSFYSLVESYR